MDLHVCQWLCAPCPPSWTLDHLLPVLITFPVTVFLYCLPGSRRLPFKANELLIPPCTSLCTQVEKAPVTCPNFESRKRLCEPSEKVNYASSKKTSHVFLKSGNRDILLQFFFFVMRVCFVFSPYKHCFWHKLKTSSAFFVPFTNLERRRKQGASPCQHKGMNLTTISVQGRLTVTVTEFAIELHWVWCWRSSLLFFSSQTHISCE